MPEYHFVPVFYIGSEDADLDELGHINLYGEKLEWKTSQTGPVGRMIVDKKLISLIDVLFSQVGVQPYGPEIIGLFKSCYREGTTIQQATLEMVNQLFSQYGLLVLIPDNARLKKPFNWVVKRELLEQFSRVLVEETTKELGKHYKVQAGGREINLFYMPGDKRERIIEINGLFKVPGKTWTQEEVLTELEEYPENFSANVILRGVFQEMILPNVAFIGGGGEIAYWLELTKVFAACQVPFPVLIVRNSFLLVQKEQEKRIQQLGFRVVDFFKTGMELINELVKRETRVQLHLEEQKSELAEAYDQIKHLTGKVDITLQLHVASLQTRALKLVDQLEKKMLKAEKKKFAAQQRQIIKLKKQLFPADSLQERVDNITPHYAAYGRGLLEALCNASASLEQEFCVLVLDK